MRFFSSLRHLCGFACIVGALAISGANQPIAAEAPLLWQTETTTGYQIALATASSEKYVAVAGQSYSITCGVGACGLDALLYVQDARTGAQKWSVTYDLNRTSDINQAVAIKDNVVITAGYSDGAATNHHYWWIVSAFDADTGRLLWRDVLGDASTDYFPWQIVVKEDRVFVTGLAGATCIVADATTCDQFTRVYDLKKGAVVATLRDDPSNGGDDEALSIAVSKGRMFLGGNIGAGPNDAVAPSVRAYDLRTQRLLWQDIMPDPTQAGFVYRVVANDDRVIAAAIANDDWLIRAYDPQNGKILWSQTYSLTGKSDPGVFDGPVQMAMDEDTVVVAGYGSSLPFSSERYPKASRDWVVRAYDARSGGLLWMDRSGSPTDIDEANGGVVVSNGQAFVLGISSVGGYEHSLLRAYDKRNGRILWEDSVGRPGFSFGVTIPLSASHGRLTAATFVLGARPAGSAPPISLGRDILVRTYRIGEPNEGKGEVATNR